MNRNNPPTTKFIREHDQTQVLMDSGKIILNMEIFRIFSSETRITILKNLAQRKMTVSELSRDLEVTKSTIHEHLMLMTTAGLVNPVPDDHRWIYYEITQKGHVLLQPETSVKYVLLLSSLGFLMITGSIVAFVVYIISQTSAAGISPIQGGGSELNYVGIGLILLSIGIVILFQTFRIYVSTNAGETNPQKQADVS